MTWPIRCADVTFEMADDTYGESAADARLGDLVYDTKGGTGHVLSGRSEPQQIGWEEPWRTSICECGDVDLGDHHVVLLARQPKADEEPA